MALKIEQQAIEAALESFGDSRGQLIQLTLSDADTFVQSISDNIVNANAEEISLAAHSLKSIMRQIKANKVGDLAQAIESAAKNGDVDTCLPLNTDLQEFYSATKEFLLKIA